MGIQFTKEQQLVIDLRDRNILVSAAAGSGKTAVLVERIITRLTKDDTPLNVDQLLVLTYTDAAAAEMKERIHAAIEKALEENPGNVHLQQQATLIHQAQITTIHKFCMSVIRDYFHTIDLDPGFRVGEEGELKLLKKDVVEEVLENAYEKAEAEFINFVENFSTGKSDQSLDDLILKLFDISRSYPDPKHWLDFCVQQYEISSADKIDELSYVKDLMTEIKILLEENLKIMEYCLQVCKDEPELLVYEPSITKNTELIRSILKVNTFSEMQRILGPEKWVAIGTCRSKTVDIQKKQQVQELVNGVKDYVLKIQNKYCTDDLDVLYREMCEAGKDVKVLVDLVNEFAKLYSEKKNQKNLIDFNDMEQYALQILTRNENHEFVPSEVAANYQEKFAEVMVDEYQDINTVQETILTAVSKESQGLYNMFMVGDVKQSIYRFRLSRPELFMNKYDIYTKEDSEKQKIDLHKNFRSREEVLASSNFVFEQIMTREYGEIEYDKDAALNLGADYPAVKGNETELLLLDITDNDLSESLFDASDDETNESFEEDSKDILELEAKMIAKRIKELVKEQMVYDRKTESFRKARYSDIVVLARSTKDWDDVLYDVLTSEGVPTFVYSKEGYFKAQEVELLLQYLRILDNPRQDIPFTAVLTSVFANVSDEELIYIHNQGKKQCVFENVRSYIANGEDETLKERLGKFMNTYEDFRKRVSYTAIHTLIWQILEETGYGDYTAALSAGERRTANIDMLIEKAVAFEGTSYKGLFNFVRYIEQLQKQKVDYGEAILGDESMNMVCSMTIHKSKGLEFPIVIVARCGKGFNLMDAWKNVVTHSKFGVGTNYVNAKTRIKNQTLLKRAISQKVVNESKAEELRMLYVAMTRAKEKLILTGVTKKVKEKATSMVPLFDRKETKLSYKDISSAKNYLDWLLLALVRNKCFSGILNEYDIANPVANPMYMKDVPFIVKKVEADDLSIKDIEEHFENQFTKEILYDWDTDSVYHEEMKKQIEDQFAYEYAFASGQTIKQKLSVSELKKKAYMEESDADMIPFMPKFLQEEKELTGASRGTAYHKLMEILDYSKKYDEESLQKELERLQQTGRITTEMLSCIKIADVLQFLETSVGKRMQQAYQNGVYFAEQPFVLGIEAKQVYPEASGEEIVLVQGIIDVYFEEDGELVVLDYKTDKVSDAEELVKRYHAQLDYYAQALENLTGKKVKEKIVYSFTLQTEIQV